MDLGEELTLSGFLIFLGAAFAALAVVLLFLRRQAQDGWKRDAEWSEDFATSASSLRPILDSLREFDDFMVALLNTHSDLFPAIPGAALGRAWDETRGDLIALLDAVDEHWNEPEVRSKLTDAGLTGEVGEIKAAILKNRVRRAKSTLEKATDMTLGKGRKRNTAVGAAKAGNVVIKSLIAAANATVVLAPLALKAHAATEVKDFAEVILQHGGD